VQGLKVIGKREEKLTSENEDTSRCQDRHDSKNGKREVGWETNFKRGRELGEEGGGMTY